VEEAIAREEQLKGLVTSEKNIALIESGKPRWRDLGAELPGAEPGTHCLSAGVLRRRQR